VNKRCEYTVNLLYKGEPRTNFESDVKMVEKVPFRTEERDPKKKWCDVQQNRVRFRGSFSKSFA
jgi:hypothetical protein